MEPLLQVKNIAKEFPGVKALEDISIDFYPGECHALVGENGAGKSTLIKIIASIYKPTRGEVILDGKVCNFKTPKDALDAGIADAKRKRQTDYWIVKKWRPMRRPFWTRWVWM